MIIKRLIRYVAGILFILLGITGLFLPILQGILFIILGMLILAPECLLIRRITIKIRKKFPQISKRTRTLKEKLARFRKKR